ncbi:hypothetical protein A6C57_00985 [Fibrella sp. ES10-3-2-2]|nr:hypothetical protein A6C57_00985 [Fibrella sp. ES10-3-2-2]
MFAQINLLFTAGTIEDDRASMVLNTLCQLIEQKQKKWGGFTTPELTEYCLGVSIDEIQAALPVTMGSPTHPDLRPALTIYQTIQAVERLTHEFQYVSNEDGFEVIHLRQQMLYDLNRAADQEIARLQASIEELSGANLVSEANITLLASIAATPSTITACGYCQSTEPVATGPGTWPYCPTCDGI